MKIIRGKPATGKPPKIICARCGKRADEAGVAVSVRAFRTDKKCKKCPFDGHLHLARSRMLRPGGETVRAPPRRNSHGSVREKLGPGMSGADRVANGLDSERTEGAFGAS
jgi:hypothetical protein